MTKTLLLGSIGVLAETSDIQRRAYNAALDEAGLGWHWTPGTYRDLLKFSGGKARLRLLADATGTEIGDDTIDRASTPERQRSPVPTSSSPRFRFGPA